MEGKRSYCGCQRSPSHYRWETWALARTMKIKASMTSPCKTCAFVPWVFNDEGEELEYRRKMGLDN
jgi:hypothetical protein